MEGNIALAFRIRQVNQSLLFRTLIFWPYAAEADEGEEEEKCEQHIDPQQLLTASNTHSRVARESASSFTLNA